MKRAAIAVAILLSAAGIAWLQTAAPAPGIATFMPSGALLVLEAADFGRLLREWNGSKVKQNWLASDNYAVFEQSNLFSKLGGVYKEYAAAAGFAPGLRGIGEIAGAESALALYGIRDVEFLYVSRVPQPQLNGAQLWAVRGKFERREAAGTPFWLRRDRASGRAVGFAFVRGWLIVATRDDLIARALELLAGGKEPSVASERWYREATASAGAAGELRMVTNLDALVKSSYFRSYWVQRNASVVGQFSAGIADVNRTAGEIGESRLFLRRAENPGAGPQAGDSAAVARLAAMAPDNAGLYRAWAASDAALGAGSIVDKLIAPPASSANTRTSPGAADLSRTAGTESDFETRIDEPPPPSDATLAESAAPLRNEIEKAGLRAMLQVQSTVPAPPAFVRMPCVLALSAASAWDQAGVERALTGVVEPLWTSAGMGAGWRRASAGNASVRALDGLGKVYLAARGNILFLANDADLLGAVLERGAAAVAMSGTATYAAAFRMARERAPYESLMTALDFAAPVNETEFGLAASATRVPAFFSRNLASLGRVLPPISEIRVTEQDDGARVRQKIVYRTRAGRR